MNIIPSPSIVLEQSVVAYLSSSLSGSGLSFYTGIDNEDKIPPCVIVSCKSCNEVYPQTRNYQMDADIIVKEIAYDDTVSNYSNLAGNVFSYFGDTVTSSMQLSTYGNAKGINIYQTQILGMDEQHLNDAWISGLTIRFVGGLVPPTT